LKIWKGAFSNSHHDPVSYALFQSVYGIGKIGALTILYEIEDIGRFPRVARLVKGEKSSAGKSYGTSGNKIGNAHLKWAFSEAAVTQKRIVPVNPGLEMTATRL
jgi:transposase